VQAFGISPYVAIPAIVLSRRRLVRLYPVSTGSEAYRLARKQCPEAGSKHVPTDRDFLLGTTDRIMRLRTDPQRNIYEAL
jgi:hypothetical protein